MFSIIKRSVDFNISILALEYNNVVLPVQGKPDTALVDVQCRIWACAANIGIERVKNKSTAGRPVSLALSQ